MKSEVIRDGREDSSPCQQQQDLSARAVGVEDFDEAKRGIRPCR